MAITMIQQYISDFFKKIGARAEYRPDTDTIDVLLSSGTKVTARGDQLDALRYMAMQAERAAGMQNAGMQNAGMQNAGMTASAMQAQQQALNQFIQQQLAAQTGMFGSAQNVRPVRILTESSKLAHPMITPPLFKPFAGSLIFDPSVIATLTTVDVLSSDKRMDTPEFPERPASDDLWVTEYGRVHQTVEEDGLVIGGSNAIVLGIDPLHVAWFMRFAYTAIQCSKDLPKTLEMVQLAGATKIADAVKELPGMGGSSWAAQINHLMFGTHPWCMQFQDALRRALTGEPPALAGASDQRLVFVGRDVTPIKLTEFLTGLGRTDLLRTINNQSAFWREAHPVAMDWVAVT